SPTNVSNLIMTTVVINFLTTDNMASVNYSDNHTFLESFLKVWVIRIIKVPIEFQDFNNVTLVIFKHITKAISRIKISLVEIVHSIPRHNFSNLLPTSNSIHPECLTRRGLSFLNKVTNGQTTSNNLRSISEV